MQRVFYSSLNLYNFDCVSGVLQHLTWKATAGSQQGILLHSLTCIFKKSKFRQFTLPSLPPTSSFFPDLKLSTLFSLFLFITQLSLQTFNIQGVTDECAGSWESPWHSMEDWKRVILGQSDLRQSMNRGTKVNYKLLTRCLVS